MQHISHHHLWSLIVEYDCPPWSLWVLRWAWRPILDPIILVQCGQGNALVVDLGWACLMVALPLSDSALVLCSIMEVIIILCSALTDKVSPGRPVFCHVFPGFKDYVALLYVGFNVILVPLLLASLGTFPFNQLGVQDLFWEARVRHADNVTSPSELVLGNDGSHGGNVSLLQDAGVGALVLPADPKDFS